MKELVRNTLLGLATASLAIGQTSMPVYAQSSGLGSGKIKHVLLISVDGMHAVDFVNCANGIGTVNNGDPYCPNLAALGQSAVNYVAASTSKPSDSFPGLMTLMTGASPRSMGIYYDVAYDRSLDAPAETTGNGLAAGACTPYGAPTGTTTEYEEGIDKNQLLLNGGNPRASLTDGGINSIQPKRLIRNPANGCAPVYPWEFVRVNTIYGVIHAAGGYTAWSDKHPSYSAVGGAGLNLDDYYAPEINSTVVALPGYTTPLGESCSTILDPAETGSWTDSFQNIRCYDTIKVDGILNEIKGKDHLGRYTTKVPTIFGMNFQAVSVGQKLIEKNVATGGYVDAQGTPTASLLKEIQFVDASLGEMVQELKAQGLYDSTLIIVTAKHGQSPIDPHLYKAVPGASGTNGTTPATVLAQNNLIPLSESPLNPTGIGATEDDVSLLWLNNSANTQTGVDLIEKNAGAVGLGQLFYGPALWLNYNKPGLATYEDPRTPDIIVTPNVGVTYTGSSTKLAEHGGFAHDDTNVILLVSNPYITKSTVSATVTTAQVAPTILNALGLNPQSLDAVRVEGTPVLPDIDYSQFAY